MKKTSLYGVEMTPYEQMRFTKWQDNQELPSPNTITAEERKERVLQWLNRHDQTLYTITAAEYNEVPNDYRSIYESGEISGIDFNGKRTLMTWIKNEGTVLLIEGASLKFVDTEAENTNPARKKRNIY